MRKILALAASLCLVASSAAAQAPSQSAASKSDLLSMDQKIKIAQLITKRRRRSQAPAFRLRLIALSHRTSTFILCPPKRNDWHRNCAASAISSSRSKSPWWTSARARSNSYFRAGANSASAYPISSDLIPRSKWRKADPLYPGCASMTAVRTRRPAHPSAVRRRPGSPLPCSRSVARARSRWRCDRLSRSGVRALAALRRHRRARLPRF